MKNDKFTLILKNHGIELTEELDKAITEILDQSAKDIAKSAADKQKRDAVIKNMLSGRRP